MTYHDLEIELDRCVCGQPEIRVLQSTFDRPRAAFTLSEERRKAIEKKVKKLDCLLLRRFHHVDRDDQAARDRRALAQEIGNELFEVLLSGEIRGVWQRSTDDAQLRRGGMRLRLSFGKEYDHALGDLPWELLCHPESKKFIANDKTTSIARYLDPPERVQPLAVVPPLKVLVVIASPDPETAKVHKYGPIDKPRHHDALDKAIGSATYLEPFFLEELAESGKPTLSELQRVLQEAETAGSPFHAVHILCHGGFDRDDHGVLFFEREDGSEHTVDGRVLAEMLTQDVRLVVLTSCNTGKVPVPRRGGSHPFAGVASALVADGIPAVVATQFALSEDAAIAFSDAFYHAIDEKRPIDDAVTRGRLWITAKGVEGALEWATPVLFLRAFDGEVLNLTTETKPPKTVAIFNVRDEGKQAMKHVHHPVDLCDHFDGRFIRAPELWNGAVLDRLRQLKKKLPAERPLHLQIAAPLSVAFTMGFLLSAKARRSISVTQRDQVWRFDEPGPHAARLWLPESEARALLPDGLPIDEQCIDLAVIVECSRTAVPEVLDYLRDVESQSPRVGGILVARTESLGHYAVTNGGHAHDLAAALIDRITEARTRSHSKIHLFMAVPHGLALAIGLHARKLARIQLYEFAFEGGGHGSYEPSITLESSMAEV